MNKRKILKSVLAVIILLFALPSAAVFADKIIYVDDDAPAGGDGTSWATAYKFLQDALSSAAAGAEANSIEIRVAQGVYKPDQGANQTLGDRLASFELISGVALMGGYAGIGMPDPNERHIDQYETILSGDIADNDIEVSDPNDLVNNPSRAENSITVINAYETDANAVLNGLIISRGNSIGVVSNRSPIGSGLNILFGKSTVIKCKFILNSGDGSISNFKSEPLVTNCSFICNYNGMNNNYSNPTIIDCTFSQNHCAMSCSSSSNPTVTGCNFTENSGTHGGAIYNHHSNLTLNNCTFINNTARSSGAIWSGNGGVIYNTGGILLLNNCIFMGNQAEEKGAGIYNQEGSATLKNCTFTANVSQIGVALTHDSTTGTSSISNCILWDGGNEIWNNDNSIISVSYSNIQGGYSGIGNIDIEPLFADPNNGDYHLKSQAGRWNPSTKNWIQDEVTSPCIDAGDPQSPIGLEPFPNGGRINIGAYGGTLEASKSYFGEPVCETIIAGDINGDCKVDFLDLTIMASHWLEDKTPTGEFTKTYQFVPEQSTLIWHVGRAGWSIPHSIEGRFNLTVNLDSGVARFEQIDAILTNGQPPPTHPDVNLNGRQLDDFFHMTELISKYISPTAIHFEGHFYTDSPAERLVLIDLIFIGNSVHLIGSEEYKEVVADGEAYSLSAVAEP